MDNESRLGFTRLSLTPSSLGAQLYNSEGISTSQEGVGLYAGKTRDPIHDNGTVYLTSHRLIYMDALKPELNSCALDLQHVRQIELWAGFLKSSAKITLSLGKDVTGLDLDEAVSRTSAAVTTRTTWVCRVCGMSNSPSESKCSLCGVSSSHSALSQSTSSSPCPASNATATTVDSSDNRIACPTCTFLNHPSLFFCELCESPLQSPSQCPSASATPTSGATPPASSDADFVRLSFRKGGEKLFHAELKRTLQAKAWLVNPVSSTSTKPDRFTMAGIGVQCLHFPRFSTTLRWTHRWHTTHNRH